MIELQAVNKKHPPIDGQAKVTGQLEFLSDIRLPNMLWGYVLRSPYPHAKIKGIDYQKALQVPGVKAVITAEDIVPVPHGPFIPDWETLARDKVTFIGQEVAAVAALSPEAAREAAKLIEVDYEELPAITDYEKALDNDSPLVHEARGSNLAFEFNVERGNVDEAFAESDYVREEVFYPSSAFHAYLEPNGSLARYNPFDDSYTMWVASQVPYKARLLYSKALGIPADKLRIIQTPMGGGFGGKFESNYHVISAHLSKKAGQPVRLVNDLADEFVTATLRVPMEVRLKVGIKKDGTIMARESQILADNGARTNYGPASVSTACFRVDSLYRVKNVRSQGKLVYTNNVPKGAMRGFGNPQMLLAMESILDMLAEDAGLDPGEIRIKNSFENGEVSVHGWEIGSCGLPECVEKAQEASNWHEKRSKSREVSGTKKRGLGIACCNHVSGYRPILADFDGSSAVVRVDPSGNVTVFSGEVDMGQGYKTVAVQIAAEELGLTPSQVEIAPVDSDTSPLGIGCLASRGTLMGGNAVKRAAQDARENILAVASQVFDRPVENLELAKGLFIDKTTAEELGEFREVIRKLANTRAGQPFVGTGFYTPDTVFPDPKTQYGNPSPAYSFAAHVAEVEVDTETGQVEVVNYVAANDVGKVINPLLAAGQLEGGALQAIGWALTEDIVLRDGDILNKNLLDYKIPTMADMTNVVPILVEEEDPNGPYGAKSLGEPAFNPVAAAVCNAIYDAVGVRPTKLPVKPEYVLEMMEANKA